MKYYEKLALLIFIFSTVFYEGMDDYAWIPMIGLYISGAVFLLHGYNAPNKSLNADVANRPEEITPEMLTSTVMYLRDLKKYTEVNEHYWINDPEELENIIQTLTRHAG